jgi:hypothetical protein
MDDTARISLAFLLRRLSLKDQEALYCYLPKEDVMKIRSTSSPFIDLFSLESHQALAIIHYGWITPILRKLSENDVRLVLSSLNEKVSNPIKTALLFKDGILDISEVAKQFFKRWLWQEITEELPSLLPISCLPQNPFNDLLMIASSDVSLFIDLLAMHDVNVEIKQIIENSKLKNIHDALSSEQTRYLALLAQKKERVAFKKMNLAAFSGSRQSLQQLLRQRGINRLAKALYGEDTHLIWYVKHRLSMDNALLFDSLLTDLHNAKATQALKEDVLDALANIPKTLFEDIA